MALFWSLRKSTAEAMFTRDRARAPGELIHECHDYLDSISGGESGVTSKKKITCWLSWSTSGTLCPWSWPTWKLKDFWVSTKLCGGRGKSLYLVFWDAMEDNWELLYWPGFPGRGEFVRLVFEEAGVPYTDLVRDGKWTTDDMVKYFFQGGNTGYPVFAPPVVRKGDFQLQSSQAIMMYLGKQFGLYPSDEKDAAHALQVALTAADVVSEAQTAFHPVSPSGTYASQREQAVPFVAEFAEKRLPRFFKQFEDLLAANKSGSEFFVGSQLTYCDLSVFHVLCGVEAQFADFFKKSVETCPRLHALKKAIEQRPNIAAYLKSDRRQKYSEDSLMWSSDSVLVHPALRQDEKRFAHATTPHERFVTFMNGHFAGRTQVAVKRLSYLVVVYWYSLHLPFVGRPLVSETFFILIFLFFLWNTNTMLITR